MLSITLILGLYFVRIYNHFIRQWLDKLIYLGVIRILPFSVLFVCRVLGFCSDSASQSLCHAISPDLFLVFDTAQAFPSSAAFQVVPKVCGSVPVSCYVQYMTSRQLRIMPLRIGFFGVFLFA